MRVIYHYDILILLLVSSNVFNRKGFTDEKMSNQFEDKVHVICPSRPLEQF